MVMVLRLMTTNAAVTRQRSLGRFDVGDDDNFDDDDPGGDDKHGCDSAAAIKCKLSDRALFCLS